MKFAYGIVSDSQIIGPDWIKSKAVRFDIVAQASPDTSREQLQRMLQVLPADRLRVVLHSERKDLPFLALVAGRNGPKVRKIDFAPPPGTSGNFAVRGRILGSRMPMQSLATLLSRFEGQIIVDMTGLQGLYEIKLEWTPDDQPGADFAGGPSIYTAVQDQLGLNLESRKGPLDVLVVDRAERVPIEN